MKQALKYVSQPENANKISQNLLWGLHGNYIIVQENLQFLLNRSGRLDPSLLPELHQQLERLTQKLNETHFFELAQQRGLTLIPKADEKVKKELPREWKEKSSYILLMIRTTRPLYTAVKSMGKRRHQKRHVARMGEFYNIVNGYLAETETPIDPSQYDVTPLELVLREVKKLGEAPGYRRMLSRFSNSWIKHEREIAQQTTTQQNRFLTLAAKFIEADVPPLRVIDSEVVKPVSTKEVQDTLLRLIEISDQNHWATRLFVPDWTITFFELTRRIQSPSDLSNEPDVKYQLGVLMTYVNGSVARIPTWRSILPSWYSWELIQTANSLRAEIDRVLSVIRPSN